MWAKTWTLWVYATRLFTFFLCEGWDVTSGKLLSYAHSSRSSPFSKKPSVVCLTCCALELHDFDLHWHRPHSDNVQSPSSIYTSPLLVAHHFLRTVEVMWSEELLFVYAGFDVYNLVVWADVYLLIYLFISPSLNAFSSPCLSRVWKLWSADNFSLFFECIRVILVIFIENAYKISLQVILVLQPFWRH